WPTQKPRNLFVCLTLQIAQDDGKPKPLWQAACLFVQRTLEMTPGRIVSASRSVDQSARHRRTLPFAARKRPLLSCGCSCRLSRRSAAECASGSCRLSDPVRSDKTGPVPVDRIVPPHWLLVTTNQRPTRVSFDPVEPLRLARGTNSRDSSADAVQTS